MSNFIIEMREKGGGGGWGGMIMTNEVSVLASEISPVFTSPQSC